MTLGDEVSWMIALNEGLVSSYDTDKLTKSLLELFGNNVQDWDPYQISPEVSDLNSEERSPLFLS